MTIADELKAFPVFADLPDSLLAWLEANGTVQTFERNEPMFEPGAPAEAMFVVLTGVIHVERHIGAQFLGTFTAPAGMVTGVLPYSRMTHFQGRGFAAQPTRLLSIPREKFPEMLVQSEEFGRRLIGIMSDRVRDTARGDHQREKLTALGTLAAGIAHELNNPAAAVRRAAATLRERVAALPELTGALVEHGIREEQYAALCEARAAVLNRERTATLTPVKRGRLEQAVGDWLEARGVAEPWLLAETYVDAGLTVADLERLAGTVPAPATPDLLAWIEAMVAADRLVQDIAEAADRISGLVGAVKAYSHLDRAQEKQPMDLRIGLDSTIVMLGHKIKRKSATVERVYAESLPEVPVFPGEINQVWTNLLDNALDAIAEGGCIRVETLQEGRFACVRITDNGTGIPEEVKPRIFEPFFTTKPMGVGTGLGLDIAQRIVIGNHQGDIGVQSVPGETSFTVCLPLVRES